MQNKDFESEAEVLMDVLGARRSIRHFKSDPVPPDKVAALLHAAILAPSGANLQPWDFVVVSDPGIRDNVAELLYRAHRQIFGEVQLKTLAGCELEERATKWRTGLHEAPLFIVACLHRKRRAFQESNRDPEYWDILSMGAAVENLLLAATALGLGACWMGAANLREDELKSLLGIPAEARIAAVIPIGYPNETPRPRPREPFSDVVHENGW